MIDGVVQNPNTNRRQSEPKKDTLSLKSHRPQIPPHNLNDEAFTITISLDPIHFGQKASA
jgi:hypothetical protein